MSGAGDEPAPAAFWARVRERYEEGRESVAAIAADMKITRQTLTVRARREGWRLRASPRKGAGGTRETLQRLSLIHI